MADSSAAGTAGTTDREAWTRVLDELTERHAGERITIEWLDRTYGDQSEVERLPFAYASYDQKDDVVIVAVGGKSPQYPVVLRHMIWHPTGVSVATESGVTAIRVVDKDGAASLVTFYPEAA
jgi:hypothetical protein